MKVLLVANYPRDQQQSMRRFANAVEEGLRQRGHEVRVTYPEVILGRLGARLQFLRKWLGYVDKLVVFPPRLRRLSTWADIVHICDHSNATYVKAVENKPIVVTCHDMLAIRSAQGEFGQNPTRWSGRLYQRMIRAGLQRAPIVVCVSEATRADFSRLIGNTRKSLHVVHNGLNYPYRRIDNTEAAQTLSQLGLYLRAKYLLHIGSNHWYKNRMAVLRIFAELVRLPGGADLSLVLAGEPLTAEMDQYITAHGLAHRISIVINPNNEQLCALYSNANGLLYPSLHEGFGWPIIEAHACGCAVFTTNRAPMTEVGGDAAIYIDPEKPLDAATKVEKAILSGMGGGDSALRNATRFTRKNMIDGYISVYEQTRTDVMTDGFARALKRP